MSTDTDSSSLEAAAHSILLNESVYKTLASDKKRPLFLHEWLCYLERELPTCDKVEIKKIQAKITGQLFSLFNAFPGPPIRHLIARNIATLFSIGDILELHATIQKCNDIIRSREHETQMQQMAKLCALNVIGSLYEKLGRMGGSSYEDTVQVLLKYMKSADSQVRIEIIQTFEKILLGLGTAGQSIHKQIYKQMKDLVLDRVQSVRCASIKCLCEMIKHSTFLYASSMSANQSLDMMAISPELDNNIKLGFKALDGSNYDVRCSISIYLAQLVFYSLTQIQRTQQQLQAKQQLANAVNTAVPDAAEANTKQARKQAIQQQQNTQALMQVNEKTRNILALLANGFSKLNSSSSFNYVRGAASSLAASAGVNSSPISTGNHNSMDDSSLSTKSPNPTDLQQHRRSGSNPTASPSTSGSVVNREVRIGVTYAYVELANLLGPEWLEKNLRLYLLHVLNLVNNTKAVSTHLDAVYSRKCVQFILRSIIGGMLNEKVQLQAARELVNLIDKCMNGVDLSDARSTANLASNPQTIVAQQQHVLICALFELSCILKCLNTSASILVNDDIKMVDRILATLMHPNVAVKCVSAWCLRTLAYSLPAMMTPLLDNCMDRLSMVRNSSDALVGYGYACAALLGAIHACPLGVPHLKPKVAFNIGEELLRIASQSNNIQLALHKTSTGWLLLGAFMTMGSTIVCKHLPRMKKLWNLTMPSSLEQLESEKKRGDLSTWQLSLESRAGALASIHSFLVNCSDMVNTSNESTHTIQVENGSETSIGIVLAPIEGAILLLSQLPSIIKQNNNSVILKVQAATFRLKLYQTLIAMPSAHLYESNFAVILRELVAEFTLADQQSSSVVTSMLRSVCHSNDSILFANCWLQDSDFKEIEDQLQPFSASGCEALEHDVTYLYQRASATSSSLGSLNSLYSSKKHNNSINSSATGNFSSLQTAYSNSIVCLAALPLGVAVIDAAIQLYGLMYPKVPNKHRLQMLLHFSECIQKQATSKANAACKQALQINIFTAVLGSLKALAESKTELGDDAIRKATLKLVMETLCHSNPILRCAAGEALGRMAQVIGESHFVIEVAQFCFEKLRNSKDEFSKTGYALGLGCLHRYLGSMGAGQHMTSSLSILFALAQNSSSSSQIVQVWAIHALYLITDSGGSMFRNYIEPCVEFIVQSVLSISYTNRDVFVGLGKLLNSLISFMGPELQIDSQSASEMRDVCLTTCHVMKIHSDSMIRAEAIKCLQELHLFASKYVKLESLVPHLLNSLVSKDFLLRKVAISCLRQLCQKDSLDVCSIAEDYVKKTNPIGLISLIGDRGLECLLFKMLDIETNPYLIRDIHDILNSLLCTLFSEFTLKDWLFLCKDIAISADDSKEPEPAKVESKIVDVVDREDENDDENYDDSESFQASASKDTKKGSSTDQISETLRLKQITKVISPKWSNRVFAVELIRKIIQMCASTSSENEAQSMNNSKVSMDRHQDVKYKANFDLNLAKKLKSQHQLKSGLEPNYLIMFLPDLMRVSCIAASGSSDMLKLAGLDLLNDLISHFAKVEEPNPEFKGHLILEQYQAQVSAALRPQFSIETSAHVTAKACQVCSMWISSGIARDLNDLRRVHQLLVSSLQKLTNTTDGKSKELSKSTPMNILASSENLIYSELSLTVEKLAVLRAWAEVYIVAEKNAEAVKAEASQRTKVKITDSDCAGGSNESLLSLVHPELALLSYHWSIALKDYAYLSLPNEYSCQLPIEGGAFYHADLVESSRPIYNEHFTKILLAYSIWLKETEFEVKELSTKSEENQPTAEQKEKLFFMLLGLGLEHLSNTTGLAQLSDETIEDILESIDYLLKASFAQDLILNRSVHLCVEILSILYKVKLTRDSMSINLLVLGIVDQVIKLQNNNSKKVPTEEMSELELKETDSNKVNPAKREKNATSLVFVVLEICIRDLIKYLPNLLETGGNASMLSNQSQQQQKSTFIHMHINTCKVLGKKDVELLSCVMNVLNQIPFQPDIKLEKQISLISIVYHIQFNLLQTVETLLNNDRRSEADIYEQIYNSFKVMCSTSDSKLCQLKSCGEERESTEPSKKLLELQQTALMNTLTLKNVDNCIIMKVVSIFFQYCSMKVFEPLNVYEKCKVFMCSMRCSDIGKELLCMIQSLNEILSNRQTKKELRVVLLKEHLSYLLKLTSSTSDLNHQMASNSHFLSKSTEEGIALIKSLLDLLESMVNLMSEESKEQETLTVFIHILSTYLSDNSSLEDKSMTNQANAKYVTELNDLVLKKLISLGTNHKEDFKLVLGKWPEVKNKIENAFKLAATASNCNGPTQSRQSVQASDRTSNNISSSKPASNSSSSGFSADGRVKAPKIQLKTFGNFK